MKISKWPKEYLAKFTIKFVAPSFANVSNPEKWKIAYKPCSAERILLHVRTNRVKMIA